MGWLDPTNHNAPGWTDPLKAYDNAPAISAYQLDIPANGYVFPFEFIITAINCDRVQIHLGAVGDNSLDIQIRLFYGGAYHQIWAGVIGNGAYVEKVDGAGAHSVTKAEVTFVRQSATRKHALIADFDFWEAPAPVGWTGKIAGVTNPAKIMGVDVANIAKVKGVA